MTGPRRGMSGAVLLVRCQRARPGACLRGPRRRDLHRAAASFMLVEEVPGQPSVPPLALHEQGGGTAPAAPEGGRVTPVLVHANPVLACGERCLLGRAQAAGRSGRRAAALAVHVFLAFRYRRAAHDAAASSPGAMPAAAVATPVVYLCARIACLLVVVWPGSAAHAGISAPDGRGRKHAQRAGGDLVLAAPHERILRILAIIGTAHGFSVHASMEAAAASAGDTRRAAAMNGAAGVAVPASRQPRPLAGACADPGGIASELSGVPG